MVDFFQELPMFRKRIHDLAKDVLHNRHVEMMLVGLPANRTIGARFSILSPIDRHFQYFATFESKLTAFCMREFDDAIKRKIKDAFTYD